MIDWKICSHCQDKFIFNHDFYRPKVRYSIKDGEPFNDYYCSDACEQGLNLAILPPCECEVKKDMRKMILTEGRKGDKWMCPECFTIFVNVDSVNFLDTMMKEEG